MEKGDYFEENVSEQLIQSQNVDDSACVKGNNTMVIADGLSHENIEYQSAQFHSCDSIDNLSEKELEKIIPDEDDFSKECTSDRDQFIENRIEGDYIKELEAELIIDDSSYENFKQKQQQVQYYSSNDINYFSDEEPAEIAVEAGNIEECTSDEFIPSQNKEDSNCMEGTDVQQSDDSLYEIRSKPFISNNSVGNIEESEKIIPEGDGYEGYTRNKFILNQNEEPEKIMLVSEKSEGSDLFMENKSVEESNCVERTEALLIIDDSSHENSEPNQWVQYRSSNDNDDLSDEERKEVTLENDIFEGSTINQFIQNIKESNCKKEVETQMMTGDSSNDNIDPSQKCPQFSSNDNNLSGEILEDNHKDGSNDHVYLQAVIHNQNKEYLTHIVDESQIITDDSTNENIEHEEQHYCSDDNINNSNNISFDVPKKNEKEMSLENILHASERAKKNSHSLFYTNESFDDAEQLKNFSSAVKNTDLTFVSSNNNSLLLPFESRSHEIDKDNQVEIENNTLDLSSTISGKEESPHTVRSNMKKYLQSLRSRADSVYAAYNKLKNKMRQSSFTENYNETVLLESFRKVKTPSPVPLRSPEIESVPHANKNADFISERSNKKTSNEVEVSKHENEKMKSKKSLKNACNYVKKKASVKQTATKYAKESRKTLNRKRERDYSPEEMWTKKLRSGKVLRFM